MDAAGDDGATASAGGAGADAAAAGPAAAAAPPTLSASVVARHFASVYYEAMSARPQFLHRFYKAGSSLSHDGSAAGPDAPPVTIDGADGDAMAAIVAAMPRLRHPGAPVATIEELTAQYSCGGCVHVLVRGVFTLPAPAVAAAAADAGGSGGVANGGMAVANGHAGVSSASSTDGESGGSVMQPFVQSFVLGPQDGGYYVHNDILNYVAGASAPPVAAPRAVAQAPTADCASTGTAASAVEAAASVTAAAAPAAAAPTAVSEEAPPSSSSASVEAPVAPTPAQQIGRAHV